MRAWSISQRATQSGAAPVSGVPFTSSGCGRVTISRHCGHWTFFFRLAGLTVNSPPHAGQLCSRVGALAFTFFIGRLPR